MLIAVYGSLKRGFWNYDRFLKDAKFLGESTVKGVMTMPMGYPYLFKGADIKKSNNELDHTVEIYDVADSIGETIGMMERGSGYYEVSVPTEHGEATTYYARHELYNKDHQMVEKYDQETYNNYRS